jgi:hypothetical protein
MRLVVPTAFIFVGFTGAFAVQAIQSRELIMADEK